MTLRVPEGVVRPPGYRLAAGDWFHGLAPWTIFATTTFAQDVNELRADAAFYRWVRAMARGCNEHVTVAYASDYQPNGFLHFHSLLNVPIPDDRLSLLFECLDFLWRDADTATGWTDFKDFISDKGAAWYLPEHRHVGVGIACPRLDACRRRTGCRVTRFPL